MTMRMRRTGIPSKRMTCKVVAIVVVIVVVAVTVVVVIVPVILAVHTAHMCEPVIWVLRHVGVIIPMISRVRTMISLMRRTTTRILVGPIVAAIAATNVADFKQHITEMLNVHRNLCCAYLQRLLCAVC